MNIPGTLPSSPIKMYAKSVQGFMSYDWTDKQRNRQTEMTTLYVEVTKLLFIQYLAKQMEIVLNKINVCTVDTVPLIAEDVDPGT